jgi:hypothetical protein
VVLDHANSSLTAAALHRVDPSSFIRATRDKLRAVKSPLMLLAGRWSAPHSLRKNFVYSFAGELSLGEMAKYDTILFEPFGKNCRGVPEAGFASVMFNGVPCLPNASGHFPSPAELLTEIQATEVCKGRPTLAWPRWLRDPARKPDHVTLGSVIWSFYDPTGEGMELLLRAPPALFGRWTRVQKFHSLPTLVQCDHCLRLGHSKGRCPRTRPGKPPIITCGLCGGPHTVASHPHHCPAPTCTGATCLCPVSCFLCREKGLNGAGHGALSQSCPLRKKFRVSPATMSPTRVRSPSAPPTARVDEAPPHTVALTPTPVTAETVMVVDPAAVSSLMAQAGPSRVEAVNV